MVFSSLPFLLLFLLVVLLVSHILPFKFRNFFLLLANLVFYAYGEPVYVLIMIGSILVNYFGGVLIEKQPTRTRKRVILILGIVIDLAALGVFKYAGLFVGTLKQIPAFSGLPDVSIALPIGISFYTFQAVSYLIDVYWDDCEASHSLVNFACYISLFPQLIAGPIVRYKDVNDQLISRHETPTLFNSGVRLFMVGMAKKVLLANQFGMLWDTMSADPVAAGMLGAWAGACAYTLQIYFDFAGYSDMARGLGRMLGFEFMRNFNYPYIAKSVTEFWRRWHISLGTWFREYLYIPLGGNRVSKPRLFFNLLVVWAATGIWHGASWNFLIWGLYFAVLLILEKAFLGKLLQKLPAALQHLYTLFLVLVSWAIFAVEDFGHMGAYLKAMFGLGGGLTNDNVSYYFFSFLPMLIIAAVASTPLAAKLWKRLPEKPRLALLPILLLAGLVFSTAYLVDATYNPFLYFRF